MFQETIAYDAGGWPVNDPVRPKQTRRKRLADRRAKERSEYERRKLAEECTRCSVSVRGRDDQLCPGCREAINVAKRASSSRLAARRRAKKQCARCGRPSPDRYECVRCLSKLGRAPLPTPDPTLDPAAPISHRAVHASARAELEWKVEGDGRRRRRGRGRGSRGHPSRAQEDATDLLGLHMEIERAQVAFAHYHSPEVQELPRIQRAAALEAALGHLELAERFRAVLVDRAKRRLR